MTKPISKSSFIRGMKCQKSLWLHFNMPVERDEISESQLSIFDTGHNVGALAQQLYPGGIDASRGEPGKVGEAVEYTRQLIAGGQEVIYEAAFDPRPGLIEALLSQLGTKGSIIVWNATFKKTRLKEIARDFPQYAGPINALLDRMVDLMVPFRRKHLYTPEMNGSYSLKAVLPALIPDLSYSDLEIQ